jgi:hypothetical protein
MFFAFLLRFAIIGFSIGQVVQRGKYWSTLYDKGILSAKAIHSVELQKYQLAELRDEDNFGPPKFAHAIDFSLDSNIDGEWIVKGKLIYDEFLLFVGKLRIWRAQVSSPGALSISLLFDYFELAPDSEFYIKTDKVFSLNNFSEANWSIYSSSE